VFIHYNEPDVSDNDIIVVSTSEYSWDNEYHRSVTDYSYASFVPRFFGMFAQGDVEVHTTWFHSTDDNLFSADARAKDIAVLTEAMDKVIA
jgi:hypothetical protein